MKKIFFTFILLLLCSMSFITSVYAGTNGYAGIVFDLDATTPGNQNLISIPSQSAGTYIRIDVYCMDVHNLDTYEFEILYDQTELEFISAAATNPLTFEQNILESEGGTAVGWMVDDTNPGVLSLAYSLVGTDTLEAPEGEGLVADIVFLSRVATHGTLSFGNVHFYDSFSVMDIITDKGVAKLYEFGNVQGTITDVNTSEPIENVRVTVADSSCTTGTDGSYFLEYIPIGIHDITCISDTYYDTVDVVEILTNQTITRNFALEPITLGALEGWVTDENTGDPIEDALITAVSQCQVEYTAYTDVYGYYVIDSMLTSDGTGCYTVSCDAYPPYSPGEVTDVEIIAGNTAHVDFALISPIMTIDPSEIFPIVENIGGSVITNITVSNMGTAPLDWHAEIENTDETPLCFTTNRFEGVTAPPINAEVNPNQTIQYNPTYNLPSKDLWDILFAYDIGASTGTTNVAGAGCGNGFILVSEFDLDRNVHKFAFDGSLVSSWNPTWLPLDTRGIGDMAFDGEYFYGSDATNTIYQFDEDGNLYGTINSPVVVRSIAYDEINDAFWVNNWETDLTLVDRSGNVLSTINDPPSIYGSAYDNVSEGGPFLWVFGNSTDGSKIEQYDLSTLALTGVSHRVSGDFPNTFAGGLFISKDIVHGRCILGGVAQGYPDILFGYELYKWMTIEPTSGTIEPGEQKTMQVKIYWDDTIFPGELKYADIIFTPEPNCGEETVSVVATFGADTPGSISGTVILEDNPYSTGNVENVLITAVSQIFPGIYYTGCPDSTGEYTIQDVYPGTYDVIASLLYDYQDSTAVDVEVVEATNIPDVNFELNCLLGALQGTVTDVYGEPIEGATITAIGELPPSESYCDTTDGDGYYEFNPIIGQFYNFACEAEGFITYADTFTVLPSETYVENVIVGNTIEMRVEPDSHAVTLAPETQTTRLITVYNDGDAPLKWSANTVFPNRQIINIPPATNDFPRSEDKPSCSLAPYYGEPTDTPMLEINPLKGSIAYGFIVSSVGSDFVTFDTDAPGMWLTRIPVDYTPYAADFDVNGNFYAIDSYADDLYTVDIETGAFTFVGSTQASVTDLACDKNDGTMYAACYDDHSYLYTIDLTTGSATLIGMINSDGIIISIACDGKGDLWGFDIIDDALYAIDKNDGHGTYVGSVGFDGNYAQSMAWDPESNIVYMAACNNTLEVGQLRIVDTSTGATELVDTFSNGVEVTGLGFRGGGWINTNSNSGYVLPGEQEEIMVTFDATDQTVGTVLTAHIHFIPNGGQEDSVFAKLTVDDVGVSGEPEIYETNLLDNFPNPFSSSTMIRFSLKEDSHVKLSIYNIRGQLVERLVDHDMLAGIDYQVEWNQADKNIANGIYFYKLETKNRTFIKKMIMMK